MVETATCQKCGSEIETGVERCPECGYEPGAEGRLLVLALIIVGAALSLTVVGAVVGVPLSAAAIYLGYRSEQRTPTDDDLVLLGKTLNRR